MKKEASSAHNSVGPTYCFSSGQPSYFSMQQKWFMQPSLLSHNKTIRFTVSSRSETTINFTEYMMMKKYNHFTPTRLERIKMSDEKVCLLEKIWNNNNSYKLLMLEGTDTITLMIFSKYLVMLNMLHIITKHSSSMCPEKPTKKVHENIVQKY